MGEQQRRTAKRKAEIILQILRRTTTVVDVARQNDLSPVMSRNGSTRS